MDVWSYSQTGYDPGETATNGNRFLTGNGYMGYRGTMDEWGKSKLVAVNLAGVYDRNGDRWREPVNAPNGLFFKLYADGEAMALGVTEPLRHRQTVYFRRGVHQRETEFQKVILKSERIVSMAQPHLIASKVELTFKDNCEATVATGIDTDIWDINGPHLFGHVPGTDNCLNVTAKTGELGIDVSVSQSLVSEFEAVLTRDNEKGLYRTISFKAEAGKKYTFELFSSVYTSLDSDDAERLSTELAISESNAGYAAVLAAHEAAWENLWTGSEVILEGDDTEEVQRALNASLYHLHSIAPRHADSMSIPARGLSGQTYKGAVFWDSEVFLFPFFIHTEPKLAKTLLRYRIDTLNGAKAKATEYGYRGAFYAWESQEGGTEGCTNYNVVDVFTHRPVRTYFRDKQIHISGDIAYAIWRYFEITGDDSLLREGGAEVILECARFFVSRAHARLDSDKIDILDVIGPDEYHERVNNSVFTNQMAKNCLSCVLKIENHFGGDSAFFSSLIKRLGYERDLDLVRSLERRIVIPSTGIIEQFDGYFALEDCSLAEVRGRLLDEREYWGSGNGVAAHTQIIKQADVIAMMALYPSLFSDETVKQNWEYYEPRTEHGSSLSACMYALAACRFGRADLAWQHFVNTASIDLCGGGKHWAGEIYIGGTHPAANGGAWMIAVLGFAGLKEENGEISLKPCLPAQITSMRFPLSLISGDTIKKTVVTVTKDSFSLYSSDAFTYHQSDR